LPRTRSKLVVAAQLTTTAVSGSGGSKLVLSTWIACENAALAFPVEGQLTATFSTVAP